MSKSGLLSELPPVTAAAEGENPRAAPPGRREAPRRRRPRRRTARHATMAHSAITLSLPDPVLFMLEDLVTERRRLAKQRTIYIRDLVAEAVMAHFGVPSDYEFEEE